MKAISTGLVITTALLLGSPSAQAHDRCGVAQPAPGRTVFVDREASPTWVVSVDGDTAGVEAWYAIDQGAQRVTLAGARVDGSGVHVYGYAHREGTSVGSEASGDVDVHVGAQPSACVVVPAAGLDVRVP